MLIRQPVRLQVGLLLFTVALLTAAPTQALADGVNETRWGAVAKAKAKRTQPSAQGSNGGSSTGGGTSTDTSAPKSDDDQRWNKYRDDAADTTARNDQLAGEFEECMRTVGVCRQMTVGYADLPADLQARDAAAARPALPPRTLAYMAVADLRLTAPTPMIGPSPDSNRWKMAAVGYPLWLAADGDLDPPSVSDSVLDVSVSLNPRLVKVVFAMGDGERVTCTDLSRRWTPAVEPGTESPTCGHTYTEPSLPRGDYTVTATSVWAIDWTVNGATGTLPFSNSATTQLPVGELQVLVR